MNILFIVIIGFLVGFLIWLSLLESNQMKGVIFRQNDNGEPVFTPQNILLFFIAPFKHTFFWTPVLFQHNWIIVTIFTTLFIFLIICSVKIFLDF